MSTWTLEELARRIGADLEGDGGLEVRRVAPIDEAGEGDLTFLAHPRYVDWLEKTGATAVLVGREHAAKASRPDQRAHLVVEEPYAALGEALELLYPSERPEPGIREGAWIAPDARWGDDIVAFPGVHVGAGCRLGNRVVLHPGVVLGEGCRLGDDVTLHPNVVLYPGVQLGSKVVVHAGSVLGSDGFGWAREGGRWRKVPQVGGLVVEDDVEIGAGVTIDRGSIGETRIGEGTRIDNLVQIAHNVQVGPGCLLVAQSGIAGSTRLEEGVVMAGQSGAAGHLRLGKGVQVAAKSAVLQDVADGERVGGIPAGDLGTWKRSATLLARLPEILRRIRRLERDEGVPGKES